jgi:serine/threonine protein kinase
VSGDPDEKTIDATDDELPTVAKVPPPPPSVGPPPPSVGAPPSTGPLVRSTSAHSRSRADASATRSTITALHGEEAARARIFGRVTAILCAGGILAQFPYERNHTMRITAAVAFTALGTTGAWVSYRARDPATYTRFVFRFYAVVAVLAAIVFVHYFGAFSAVAAVIVLGSAFFTLGEDRIWGVGTAVTIALAHAASAALISFGIVPDVGIFPGGDSPPIARIATGVLVLFMYFMQIWQQRKNRRAMADAIERSHREARLARDREAQLDEAKENLDVALKAAAGGGRYTGTACGVFLLEEIVGRGAMGEVYAARDPHGGRVAVKLLHDRALADPDLAKRFLRETDIARRLTGPNLVQVKDVGQATDGAPYLAMELLHGTDLAALLRQRATLSLEETAELVEEVARGLTVAHAGGVVHRDLKPSNLFRAEAHDRKPVWKILDFGVSKLHSSGTLTEGHVIGTPGYMAPEQAQGKDCAATADIFSLGAVVYRAMTGRRPFAGQDVPHMLFQVVYVQPLRPRDVSSGVPRDVENVLAIALAKRPADRFASAAAFSEAFRAATKNRLADAHRLHAKRLIAEQPWGSLIDDQRATRRNSPPAAGR